MLSLLDLLSKPAAVVFVAIPVLPCILPELSDIAAQIPIAARSHPVPALQLVLLILGVVCEPIFGKNATTGIILKRAGRCAPGRRSPPGTRGLFLLLPVVPSETVLFQDLSAFFVFICTSGHVQSPFCAMGGHRAARMYYLSRWFWLDLGVVELPPPLRPLPIDFLYLLMSVSDAPLSLRS